MVTLVNKIRKGYLKSCQAIGASLHAPSTRTMQGALVLVGVGLLALGTARIATAQGVDQALEGIDAHFQYNDTRISAAANIILTYLEGSFGALVMVAAGLGAILSSAFGQYKAALGCLIIAVGSFILRSVMGTFFNTENIQQ